MGTFQSNIQILETPQGQVERLSPYGADGLLTFFFKSGRTVEAVCPFEDTGYPAKSFVTATPDPDVALVSALGQLFEFKWRAEPELRKCDYFLVSDFCSFPAEGLLVLIGFTGLIGWGKDGEVWVTDLADDQLRLHQCLSNQVVVDGYKADVGAIQRFTVDLSGGIVDAEPLLRPLLTPI